MSSLDTLLTFAPILIVVAFMAFGFGFGYSIRTQSRI